MLKKETVLFDARAVESALREWRVGASCESEKAA